MASLLKPSPPSPGQFGSPTPEIRALAVGVTNLLINIMPGALLDNMDRCKKRREGAKAGWQSFWVCR